MDEEEEEEEEEDREVGKERGEENGGQPEDETATDEGRIIYHLW